MILTDMTVTAVALGTGGLVASALLPNGRQRAPLAALSAVAIGSILMAGAHAIGLGQITGYGRLDVAGLLGQFSTGALAGGIAGFWSQLRAGRGPAG